MKLSRRKLRNLILKEINESTSSPAEKCADEIKTFLDKMFGADFGHKIFNISDNNIDGALCRVSLRNASGGNEKAMDQIVRLINEGDLGDDINRYDAIGVYSLKLINIYSYRDVCGL